MSLLPPVAIGTAVSSTLATLSLATGVGLETWFVWPLLGAFIASVVVTNRDTDSPQPLLKVSLLTFAASFGLLFVLGALWATFWLGPLGF